ncbi:MAG: three-Cys-motif partner protein TcmP [Elusimicrobiota bacterium]
MKLKELPFKTWSYQKQTEMKHKVFSEYFDKWVKILGKYYRLNYMDCFSGCGAYYRQDNIYYGSPILAAEIIKRNNKEATLVFIEKNKKNIENLKKIFEYKRLTDMKILYVNHDFDKTINNILDQTSSLAPTFFLIDPFGFKIKHSTLKRIMETDKSEILLNFLFNAVNRFLSLERIEKTKTNLFGTDKLKSLLNLKGRDRENGILNLYKEQLEQIAEFVFPYKMEFPERKRTFYYLFHLSNFWKGCSIMKSCFAKHAYGRLEYMGNRGSQLRLFEIGTARMNEVKEFLINKYNDKNKSFLNIMKENIASTKFLEGDFKKAIKNLENNACVYIERFPKTTEKIHKLRTSIEEGDVIYFKSFPGVTRKSLLYKTKVEYGNFTINHVFGCSHGCNYPCYARMMAIKYGKINNYEDWIHPRIVSNALELLEREIPKYKKEIDFVHLSFTTDPFMYDHINKRTYPQIEELTLKIIEKLNANGIKCTILTKGIYPKKLVNNEKYSKENEYGITVVSLDGKFKKEYEPFSAPFEERLNALKFLHEKGLKTWVSIEPYPTPNIVQQDLGKLLKSVSFVDKIIFGKMNYNVDSNKFENNKEFYKECASKVIKFCKEKKIKHHIKLGTPYSSSKTKSIFREGN